jgi:quercetin dioxygenase-like cupin family protein
MTDDHPAPYALGPEEGEALWGADGSLWTLKASAEKTGGPFSLIEEVGRLGEGTPLHRHAEDDEAFYVLEGEMTFHFEDGLPVPATAGSFVHIPAGAAHAFRVDSGTARYLILTTAQHESFYRAMSEPARSRTLPPEAPMDMEKVMAAAERYKVEVLGPPPGASA